MRVWQLLHGPVEKPRTQGTKYRRPPGGSRLSIGSNACAFARPTMDPTPVGGFMPYALGRDSPHPTLHQDCEVQYPSLRVGYTTADPARGHRANGLAASARQAGVVNVTGCSGDRK